MLNANKIVLSISKKVNTEKVIFSVFPQMKNLQQGKVPFFYSFTMQNLSMVKNNIQIFVLMIEAVLLISRSHILEKYFMQTSLTTKTFSPNL